MHAQHAQVFFVTGGVSAQAHQGVGDRITQHVHQGAQLLAGIAQQHPAAGVDVGAFGAEQQLQRFANLSRVAFFHRVVGTHLHVARIACVGGFLERDILGNVHHHWARTPRSRNVKRLFHGAGQIAHILDQEVVLDHRTGDAHRVALLESVGANRSGCSLTADDHQWNRIGVCSGNTRDSIGQARARSHQRHAHLAGGTGKAVGRMHRRLLMAHQDMLNAVLFVKRVVDIEHRPAGITPQVLHALGLQGFDQDFSAHQFRGKIGRGRSGGERSIGNLRCLGFGEFHMCDSTFVNFSNEKPSVPLARSPREAGLGLEATTMGVAT